MQNEKKDQPTLFKQGQLILENGLVAIEMGLVSKSGLTVLDMKVFNQMTNVLQDSGRITGQMVLVNLFM